MTSSVLKLFTVGLVIFSFSAQADQKIHSENTMDIKVLSSVSDMKDAGYSVGAQAGAKLFQMQYGDGGPNPFTAYVIIQGASAAKGFRAASMISGIKRITFSGVNQLTVNYTRVTIDSDGKELNENKSLKVVFSKTADGEIADSVEIKD